MADKITLDLDPTILEKNLLLEDLNNDDFNSLISNLKEQQVKSSGDDRPWKAVKPSAGFLVKTRTATGEKIFLNICHTEEIPPPKDLTDAELIEILNSDEPSSYRLPISIGDLHEEPDKSGVPSSVYDIAVHSNFFRKIETNQLFRSFLLSIAIEGVADKYNKQINTNDHVILKNRKVMGNLQYHRIVQQGSSQKKILIEEVKSLERNDEKPKFRIIREPATGAPELLTVQVHVKSATSGKCLLLDIGEDRLVLRSARKSGSLVDIFLPYCVDQHGSCAHFDLETKILSVELPVVG